MKALALGAITFLFCAVSRALQGTVAARAALALRNRASAPLRRHMGNCDNYHSLARVIPAFAVQRTWRQAELARHVGIQVRALLLSLEQGGMPLEKEEDHPQVFWSVPAHWFPGGVIFDQEDWQVLVHAVLRVRDPQRRERLLSRLLSGRRTAVGATLGKASTFARLNQSVAATPFSPEDHEMLRLVEQSLVENVALAGPLFSMPQSAHRMPPSKLRRPSKPRNAKQPGAL